MNRDNRHVEDGMGFAGFAPSRREPEASENRLMRCIEKLNAEREKNTALRAENERLREALRRIVALYPTPESAGHKVETVRTRAAEMRQAASAALEDHVPDTGKMVTAQQKDNG